MLLPESRGPLTTELTQALRRGDAASLPEAPVAGTVDVVVDEDVQLALWICFELHYRGFDDVDDSWEWQPELIALRGALEDQLLGALRAQVDVPEQGTPVADRLRKLVDTDEGPQLSRYLQRQGTRKHVDEFLMHRSIYQLKEADPHTWAIPRLTGRAKAALLEIQIDEYGGGEERHMHYELYRKTLRELGLDDAYGAYVNNAPGVTLAITNVISMFGLRRALRGALVGHLAAYEMTSSEPSRRYAKILRRLGASEAACEFYDAHVTADALPEQVAAHDLCGGLAEAEPDLTEDIVFGAAACLYVDNRFAEHVLDCWSNNRTSLYPTSALPALEQVS